MAKRASAAEEKEREKREKQQNAFLKAEEKRRRAEEKAEKAVKAANEKERKERAAIEKGRKAAEKEEELRLNAPRASGPTRPKLKRRTQQIDDGATEATSMTVHLHVLTMRLHHLGQTRLPRPTLR